MGRTFSALVDDDLGDFMDEFDTGDDLDCIQLGRAIELDMIDEDTDLDLDL